MTSGVVLLKTEIEISKLGAMEETTFMLATIIDMEVVKIKAGFLAI